MVVTTPQDVALADTRRAIRMYQKLNIPVLGIVENMSHFVCPACQHESDIFGKGGAQPVADQMDVPYPGQVPRYEPIRVGGDCGEPIVLVEPESPTRLAAQVSIASYERLVPTTPTA